MADTSPRFVNLSTSIVLVLIVLASLLLFLGRPSEGPSLPPAEAFPYGEIRIGVDASFPPFAFDDGIQMTGLDIALGEALAEQIGLPHRFVNIGFDGLYDALYSDQVDILISALQPDPARTRDFRYTRPYFDNGLRLISMATAINSIEDIRDRRLAFEFSSDADLQARTWQRRLGNFETLPYELPDYALDALRLGHADAALVDETTYRLYEAQHPGWESRSIAVSVVPYAIALRIDRHAAWQWTDLALRTLQEQGLLEALISNGLSGMD